MSRHSFYDWLQKEVTAEKCVLLSLYERLDQIKFVIVPQVEQVYMDKVGNFEQTVIKEEMECEVLEKKQELIQISINRNEKVDVAAIEAKTEEFRKEVFNDAEGKPQEDFPPLTSEQSSKQQELYREIIREFHPQTHPETTEVQKELFQKAQEAYRMRNVESLELVHEMLCDTKEDDISDELLLELLKASKENKTIESKTEKEEEIKQEFTADYMLVSEIFRYFRPTAEEAILEGELEQYRQLIRETTAMIEAMEEEFPLNAREMLSDTKQVEEYQDELSQRLRSAAAEKERLTAQIENMLKGDLTYE